MSKEAHNGDFIEADLYLDEPLNIYLDEPDESDELPSKGSSLPETLLDESLTDAKTVDLADAVELANVEVMANGSVTESAFSEDAQTDVEAEIVVSEVKELAEPLDPIAARRVAHGLSPFPSGGTSAKQGGQAGDMPHDGASATSKSAASGGAIKSSAVNSTAHGTSGSNASSGAGIQAASGDGASAGPDSSPQQRRVEKFRDERKAERDEKEKKAKRKRIIKIVVAIIICVLVVLAVAFVIALAFIRWGMLDDVSEIQGTWRSSQSSTEITITDDHIVLTDEVAYKYTIDTDAKTLVFTFGNLEGHARYRMSLDGKELSIYDAELDGTETFLEDAPWLVENVWSLILNRGFPSANLGAGSELFTRVE